MNTSRPARTFTALRLPLGVAGISLASLISSLFSQEVPPAPTQIYPQNQQLVATQTLSPESLKQLLAPIALYPDALIALILPASTVPSDVVLASRYVAGNGDPKQIPNQSWDNSVQSLASYPDVVTWMDQNLEWTTSLGQAFLVQPADVMNAIQELRAQAQAAGNLVNTPQQVVVKEKTFIRIVPAEPEYLYVPQYDPEIVYVQPYSQDYGPLITFGVGFAVGSWLNYDFDWNRHQIYQGDWQPGWDYSSYGNGGNNNRRVNVVNLNQNTAQPWQASSRSRQQLNQQQQSFQANSNNLSNARVASGVTAATANGAGQTVRQVPKPSRANFGNRGAGNRNSTAPSRQPSATSTQPAAGNAAVIQTTTPPNVAGQQGKPLRNSNNASAGQNVNRHGQQTGKNTAQPVLSTVQAPQNPATAQIGSVPTTNPSKKQRGATPATSSRVPQTTQAPVVDQNGRMQPTASQQPTAGKRNQHTGSAPQSQAAQPANQAQPSSAPSGKNSGHKNNNADRPSNPPAQIQTSQPATGNTHQQQKPQVQSSQPQQPSQAPKKHASESKPNNPAPQQRPQQQQLQKPQQQQQKPQQQQQQQQRPQQQPQQQPAKHQEQKAAPAAKQNPAPAAANPAQTAPVGKKSDKKKDADKEH